MAGKHTLRGIVDTVGDLKSRVDILEDTPPGSGGISHNHSQGVASLTWTIVHGKAYKPVVTLYDTIGQEIEGDVDSNLAGTTIVTFTTAIAGSASLV